MKPGTTDGFRQGKYEGSLRPLEFLYHKCLEGLAVTTTNTPFFDNQLARRPIDLDQGHASTVTRCPGSTIALAQGLTTLTQRLAF